jgi:hypothetical protein
MYTALLSYAQSFERRPYFKAAMALPQDKSLGKDILGPDYYVFSKQGNTYTSSATHSIERGLWAAQKAAVVHNSIEEFKDHQSQILMFLERQYQGICDASTDLVQFVNEKGGRSIFDIDTRNFYYHSFNETEIMGVLLAQHQC